VAVHSVEARLDRHVWNRKALLDGCFRLWTPFPTER
jgi:hypothetical protein